MSVFTAAPVIDFAKVYAEAATPVDDFTLLPTGIYPLRLTYLRSNDQYIFPQWLVLHGPYSGARVRTGGMQVLARTPRDQARCAEHLLRICEGLDVPHEGLLRVEVPADLRPLLEGRTGEVFIKETHYRGELRNKVLTVMKFNHEGGRA